jgi:hypothetical protein
MKFKTLLLLLESKETIITHFLQTLILKILGATLKEPYSDPVFFKTMTDFRVDNLFPDESLSMDKLLKIAFDPVYEKIFKSSYSEDEKKLSKTKIDKRERFTANILGKLIFFELATFSKGIFKDTSEIFVKDPTLLSSKLSSQDKATYIFTEMKNKCRDIKNLLETKAFKEIIEEFKDEIN